MVKDNNTDSGGDGTSKEQVGNYISLGTSPTSRLGRSLNPYLMILTLIDYVVPDILTSIRRANVMPLLPLSYTVIPSRRPSKRAGPIAEIARVSGLIY